MIVRTCNHCGKDYDTFPSIRLKYCSRDCANKHRRRGKFVKCVQCGGEFWQYPSKANRKYCSRSCAITARNLTEANPSYHRDITGDKNPMYGRGMSGKDNPMYGMRKEKAPAWKGGRKIRKDGYVMVVCEDDHPRPSDGHKASGTKYILEHRLVMEKHLGRYLDRKEVIHHIDGNPSNNSVDNLALLPDQKTHAALHMQEKWANHDSVTHDEKYLRYLWSSKWHRLRKEVIALADSRCEICKTEDTRLSVHHKTYERIYDERLDDLQALCARCHSSLTWAEVV